jgi:ABC-2 type transport system permease protein
MLEVVYALWRRDMVKFLRDRRSFVTSLTRPLLWLLAFGFGMRGSVTLPGAAAGVDYVSFLVAGLAAMTVLFSSMFAAISIVWEREFGFLKELLVAPVPRGAIVVAKLLAGSATALVEVIVTLALYGLGITLAARMKSFEGFGSVVNFVIQPIFFLSGALYLTEGLPRALHAFVLVNPMSYAVDGVRGLLIGIHTFPIALDVGVVVLSTLAFGALATRAFRRMEI